MEYTISLSDPIFYRREVIRLPGKVALFILRLTIQTGGKKVPEKQKNVVLCQ